MPKQFIPKVSIIIPLYVISERFFNDFRKFQEIDYSNFEILVVSDKKAQLPILQNVDVKLILTHKRDSGPAEKRDKAIKYSKADLCAFIDDDAYPDKDWLRNIVKWFCYDGIVAVGGPGLTPPEDSFWEKIGGDILESYLCSGGVQNRFYKTKDTRPANIVDWPAYNLTVRTKILKKIGGYGSTFYGGEDTLLCLKMIEHGKIKYDPNVVVFHHRRSFPYHHLRQIGGIGLHRGYFFKKYPDTSRSLFYLLPTVLSTGLVSGFILSILFPTLILTPFLIIFLFFLGLGSLSVFRHKVSAIESLIAGLGIMATHITYGSFFIKGLLIKDLKR